MHLLLPRPSTSFFTSLTSLRVPMSRPQLLWLTTYFFVLNSLWTLCTSLRSFGNLDHLFSSRYRLFCVNTGGWGTSDCQNSGRLESQERIAKLRMGINHWISRVTDGTNIDAPYHLC